SVDVPRASPESVLVSAVGSNSGRQAIQFFDILPASEDLTPPLAPRPPVVTAPPRLIPAPTRTTIAEPIPVSIEPAVVADANVELTEGEYIDADSATVLLTTNNADILFGSDNRMIPGNGALLGWHGPDTQGFATCESVPKGTTPIALDALVGS